MSALLASEVAHAQPVAHFAVGLETVRFTDTTRSIRLPGGKREHRTLVTLIRYPVAGGSPARELGPFPLIVFGHGYATTPAVYERLLRAWTSAGYVVAAPIFPLENANAPGGPDESDLINQPADMRFVITQLLASDRDPANVLYGLIDPSRIAVAGQSDGGETALAVAYDGRFRDPRVRAAIILSGAQLPGGGIAFPRGGPSLLAVQGTADTINPPSNTYSFFAKALRPKYLLELLGARHLGPYTSEEPQLRIVERVTIAFLDLSFNGASLDRLRAAGSAPGIARLVADP